MPADTLLNMARRAMVKSANRLSDVGELPYDFVKLALAKIVSPKHLHDLEQKSPQIIGCTDELWLNFIKRDVPNYQTKRHQPSDPKNWFKVYKKLMREAAEEASRGEAELKAALDGIKAKKDERTSRIVPQNHVGSSSAGVPMAFNNGRWGPKTAKSMTLMEKIKKEARDAKGPRRKIVPVQQMKQKSTVREAPPRFIEQIKRQAASPPPPRVVRPARPPRAAQPPLHAPARPRGPVVEEGYDIMKDREARLQAMKNRTKEPSRESNVSPGGRLRSQAEPAKPGGLSMGYLEDFSDEEDEPQKSEPSLKPPPNRQRSTSPAKMKPQPVLKRKAQTNSLFISPSKKPMLKRPEEL